MTKEQKYKWMQTLKVGDSVCDCRFNHQKIVKIEDEITYDPKSIRFLAYLPSIIFNSLVKLIIWIRKEFGLKRLVDRTFTLEDGLVCSAMYCCDPIDHKESHPE